MHLLGGAPPFKLTYHVRLNSGKLDELLTLIRNLPDGRSSNSVFIVPDVFEQGVPLRDFNEQELRACAELLKERGARLVFTAGLEHAGQYSRMSLRLLNTGLESNESFFAAAISNYLNHIKFDRHGNTTEERLQNVLVSVQTKIADSFQTPPQINDLFNRIHDGPSPVGLTETELEKLVMVHIEAIIRDASGVYDNWFESLSSNNQLYALLVYLFKELSKEDIHVLYRCVVSQLRRESFPIEDYRQQGIYDVYRAIKVVEDEGRDTLHFVNTSYEVQLKRQIANRRDLLWTAMAAINGWINELSDISSYHLYRKLGEAIGRLGAHQWRMLESLLEDRARLQPGMPVFLVVHVLRELVTGGHRKKILDLVESWVKSDQVPKMWTAAVAIPELYSRLIDEMGPHSSELSDANDDPELSINRLEALVADLATRFFTLPISAVDSKNTPSSLLLLRIRYGSQFCNFSLQYYVVPNCFFLAVADVRSIC